MIYRSKHQIYFTALSIIFFSQTPHAAPSNQGFQPQVNIQLLHDDNIRRTPAQNKQSDSILVIAPNLPLTWGFGKQKLDLSYQGEYAQYFDRKILDYNDHHIGGSLMFDHNLRLNTEYKLGYIREHNTPDDNNLIANLTAEPNQWKENYASASLLYGKPISQGQVISRIGYKQRDYTNNNQQFLNTDQINLSNTFFYRVSPKSRIPFEINITQYDYQNIRLNENPDSTEYKYLTGITWDATAKSTSALKIGLLKRSYENRLFTDTSIFILQLDAAWKPNTYTNVIFGAIRDTQESLQIFSKASIQNSLYGKLTHMITTHTKLSLSTRYTRAKTDDDAKTSDDRFNSQIEVQHSLRGWLYTTFSYRQIRRNSDLNLLDFKANIFMFNIRAGFGN